MAPERTITVQVVYALSDKQTIVDLNVPGGTTAEAAADEAAHKGGFVVSGEMQLGIYGRVVARGAVLQDGDRVEIYRPLIADPKQARRRRAARKI